jgi:hypothetical protein
MRHAVKTYRGVEVYLHPSWPWYWMEVSDQLHAPVALTLGKDPLILIGWEAGGPQNRSGRCGEEKILTPVGNWIPYVQSIARPSTDWIIADLGGLLFFSMALPARSGPWSPIQFRNHFSMDGRTPWTSDQPVTRPLPTHRTTQTEQTHTHTSNNHALSGIRIHDPSVRASEDSLCLRPRSYCDRRAY